jgi:hypothetical protein
MQVNPDEIISAQIILRSASGREPNGDVEITAENIDDFSPPPGAAELMADAFRTLGFEVGPMVGISFFITAPARRFNHVFNTPLYRVDDGSISSLDPQKGIKRELPMKNLQDEMVRNVYSISFSAADQLNSGSSEKLAD